LIGWLGWLFQVSLGYNDFLSWREWVKFGFSRWWGWRQVEVIRVAYSSW
jgi:hypothetical protein